jgi:hypothetical protein
MWTLSSQHKKLSHSTNACIVLLRFVFKSAVQITNIIERAYNSNTWLDVLKQLKLYEH